MGRIIGFFKESYEELRKVVWPTREMIVRHTIIVILSITISMLIIAAIDYGLTSLIEKIVSAK